MACLALALTYLSFRMCLLNIHQAKNKPLEWLSGLICQKSLPSLLRILDIFLMCPIFEHLAVLPHSTFLDLSMSMLDLTCFWGCLDDPHQVASFSCPTLEHLAALPHSTFLDLSMCLLYLTCLWGCLDDLHQVASFSCPTLEHLAALPHSNFLDLSMCLPDLTCFWECLDVLYQVASFSCPTLEHLAAPPHSTFPDLSICLLDLTCLWHQENSLVLKPTENLLKLLISVDFSRIFSVAVYLFKKWIYLYHTGPLLKSHWNLLKIT